MESETKKTDHDQNQSPIQITSTPNLNDSEFGLQMAQIQKETGDSVARLAVEIKRFFDAWKRGLTGRLATAYALGKSKDGSLLTLIASKKGDMKKLGAEQIIPFFIDVIDDSNDIMRTSDQIELNQADTIIFKMIGGPDLVIDAINHFSKLPPDMRLLMEKGIVGALSLGYQIKGVSKKASTAKALKFVFSCATSGTVILPIIAKVFGMSKSEMSSASSFFSDALDIDGRENFEDLTDEERKILDSIDDIKKTETKREGERTVKTPFNKRPGFFSRGRGAEPSDSKRNDHPIDQIKTNPYNF